MEYNGINSENQINHTTTDLLLQETIQTNQKLEEVQTLLTSIQDLRCILPESIQSVLNVQLKKMLDSQENFQEQNELELKNSRELHNSQLNELETTFRNKIEEYQRKTDYQISKIRKETQDTILDSKILLETAENRITEAVEKTTNKFKCTAKETKRMMGKNLLFNFISSVVLLFAAIGGYLYFQNYRDGTKIAEAKAVEALADERAKFELEMAGKKKQIEQEAVAAYKRSVTYREEASRFVANNITKLDCLHYMYINMRQEDIMKYPDLRAFYKSILAYGNKLYKESYGK